MVLDERARHHLHQQLDTALGPDAAATLMEHLPPVGWADVATKRDLDHLAALTRAELAEFGAELKLEIAGVHTELKTDIGGLRVELHDQLRRAMAWNVAAILAAASLALGIAQLG